MWPQKARIHNTKLSIEMFDSIILQDVGFCYTFIYYYRYSEDAFKLDILISQNSNQYNCYWCVGWLKKYYILYRLNSTENEKLVCNRFKCHFFILKYWILLLFSCCLLNPKRVIVVIVTNEEGQRLEIKQHQNSLNRFW